MGWADLLTAGSRRGCSPATSARRSRTRTSTRRRRNHDGPPPRARQRAARRDGPDQRTQAQRCDRGRAQSRVRILRTAHGLRPLSAPSSGDPPRNRDTAAVLPPESRARLTGDDGPETLELVSACCPDARGTCRARRPCSTRATGKAACPRARWGATSTRIPSSSPRPWPPAPLWRTCCPGRDDEHDVRAPRERDRVGGRIAVVRRERWREEDGEEVAREVVGHPGAVGIVAWDDQRVWLVRQPREAVGDPRLLEVPAGKLDEAGRRRCRRRSASSPRRSGRRPRSGRRSSGSSPAPASPTSR